jgi:hypothetical protein
MKVRVICAIVSAATLFGCAGERGSDDASFTPVVPIQIGEIVARDPAAVGIVFVDARGARFQYLRPLEEGRDWEHVDSLWLYVPPAAKDVDSRKDLIAHSQNEDAVLRCFEQWLADNKGPVERAQEMVSECERSGDWSRISRAESTLRSFSSEEGPYGFYHFLLDPELAEEMDQDALDFFAFQIAESVTGEVAFILARRERTSTM